jgi:glyoxylase-like metal-dependent hydrolase (beta-lactamase superfamily II)
MTRPFRFFLTPAGIALIVFLSLGVTGLSPRTVAAQDAAAFTTTQIADGVYRFRWRAHVGMFVVGDEGVAAFDPINPEAAAVYASEIKRVAGDRPLRWIIYSHSDLDHTSGGDVLSDAFGGGVPIVATVAAVDDIAEHDDPAQASPTVTFDRSMSLDLGGRTAELHFFGPSHSDNMLVGYVPQERVAFAVDFVSNDRMGYQSLPGWQFPEQNVSIKAMMGLGFETVVFGHGDVGDRASMWHQARYYDALETGVRGALEAGLSEDEAVQSVTLDEFSSFGEFAGWRELNVRGAYRILSGGR